MKTEEFNITNAMCKIDGIRFCLVCKILNYELGHTSAVDALVSIAQIDKREVDRLRALLIGIMFSEAKKLAQKILKGSGQETERLLFDYDIDVTCIIEDDIEELVERMVFFMRNKERGRAMNILVNICLKAYDEQKHEQQLEAIRERIGYVFDCARELKPKGFLRLEEMIAEVARPVENGKPIPELKEKTTEAIRFARTWRLGQKALNRYMDLEISKIYTYRQLREYEELWERTKDASTNETVEFICQIIQRMEYKMKADFESYDFEQNEIVYTINEVNKMIEDSLSEAGVQDANERGEIRMDLIGIFARHDILYSWSDEWYELLSEISENFK